MCTCTHTQRGQRQLARVILSLSTLPRTWDQTQVAALGVSILIPGAISLALMLYFKSTPNQRHLKNNAFHMKKSEVSEKCKTGSQKPRMAEK